MSTLVLVYLIFGVIVYLALMVVVFIIAGKEMMFAFLERFNPKGSHVFITNPNRHLSHYYKTAKDGVFKIDGKMYITNPDKLLGLSDNMVKEAKESMSLTKKRLLENIRKMKLKQAIIQKQLTILKDEKESIPLLENFKAQWVDMENKINTLEGKIDQREQSYYMRRRGAYLYIENDPVPKDLHEFFTEMDSIQMENVILRSQTKDLTSKSVEKMQSDLLWVKKLVIFAVIAAAAAAWFSFQNNGHISQIATNLGVVLSL